MLIGNILDNATTTTLSDVAAPGIVHNLTSARSPRTEGHGTLSPAVQRVSPTCASLTYRVHSTTARPHAAPHTTKVPLQHIAQNY